VTPEQEHAIKNVLAKLSSAAIAFCYKPELAEPEYTQEMALSDIHSILGANDDQR
jgi:hypothetical protein